MLRYLPQIIFLLFLAVAGSTASFGQTAQRGIVSAAGGTTVYQAPNFDAPQLGVIPQGKKVVISRKVYKGIGGFGSFYKVRIGPKKYGYISDIDVAAQFQPKSKKPTVRRRPKENPEYDRINEPEAPIDPIYFSRFLGGVIARADYREKFWTGEMQSTTGFLGLKMTGPGTLFDGPPIDFELLFHSGAPKYYKKIASGPSGFFLLGNALLLLPFAEWPNSSIYYGLGFMYAFTRFNFTINNTYFDSQELRLGLAGSVGYAIRFARRYVIRAEAKYYYEKTKYLGYGLALQLPY